MASEEEHCRDCVRVLGEAFPHVHAWLDEFFQKVGPKHRPIRHHLGGIEAVRRRWGDRAAEAARIHIKKDYCGRVPTEEEARAEALSS